jgi:hypothetical protein
MPSPLPRAGFAPTVRDCNASIHADKVFTTVHTLASADYDNNENHYLVAMLLHVKAAENRSTLALTPSFSAARSRGTNNMQQGFKKLKQSANYRRIFFFMDLLTEGACFVIFEKDSNDENNYWAHVTARAATRVGDILLIQEPKAIENDIAGRLSVVRTEGAFIPITRPAGMVSYVPRSTDPDCFLGFHLPATSITLTSITAVDTTCTGCFCDRLYPRAGPCGCYTSQQRSFGANFVFKQDVSFEIPTLGRHVAPCSSLRFTELLFNGSVSNTISRNQHVAGKIHDIRLALRALVAFVNSNGGWTVCGWFRRSLTGEVGTAEQVFSDTFGVHIAYIQPTDSTILANDDFKNLQKDPPGFLLS